MTQTAYKSAATAPIGFAFLEDADEAIKTYLTTANTDSRLETLRDFLQVATFRTRYEQTKILADISFPIVYLASDVLRVSDRGPNNCVANAMTRFTVWDSAGNPEDSMERCVAVAGAVASMMKQTLFDGNAGDWSAYYSNHYAGQTVNNVRTVQEPTLEVNSQGAQTGMVRTTIECEWFHFE